MSQIADLIRGHQAEIARLESEILDRQNQIAAHRHELAEAKQLLLGALGATLAPTPPAPALTSTEMAATVLQRVGHPLHVNEIMSGIEREFQASVRYATLVGNISRLIKRDKTFYRAGRNIFGLTDWAAAREADELFGESLREELQPRRSAEDD